MGALSQNPSKTAFPESYQKAFPEFIQKSFLRIYPKTPVPELISKKAFPEFISRNAFPELISKKLALSPAGGGAGLQLHRSARPTTKPVFSGRFGGRPTAGGAMEGPLPAAPAPAAPGAGDGAAGGRKRRNRWGPAGGPDAPGAGDAGAPAAGGPDAPAAASGRKRRSRWEEPVPENTALALATSVMPKEILLPGGVKVLPRLLASLDSACTLLGRERAREREAAKERRRRGTEIEA